MTPHRERTKNEKNSNTHKRILKRIHHNRKGSDSSHSSIESQWVSVRSNDRPLSVQRPIDVGTNPETEKGKQTKIGTS